MQSGTLSIDELIASGKANYRQKRYEAALQFFKLALAKSPPESMHMDILDYLAAVCDKLGEIDRSVQYGKCMIDLDETSARVRV